MTGRECALIVAAVRQRGSSSAGVQNDEIRRTRIVGSHR